MPPADPIMTRVQALGAELTAIRGLKGAPQAEQDLREVAHQLNLSALCLSGGGIRSAAFCLGALQALAQRHFLSQFDYLSTVSGGGYIGSWLQRMIHDRGSVAGAEQELGDVESAPAELRRLRDYTSYLAPRGGAFSADTWANIVLYLRNVLLTWTVYLPLFVLAVLLAIFYRTLIWTVAASHPWQLALLSVGAIGVVANTFFAAAYLPDHRPKEPDGSIKYAQPQAISEKVLWPSLVWAIFAPLSLGIVAAQPAPSVVPLLIAYFAAQTVGFVIAWTISRIRDRSARLFGSNGIAYGAATVVSTAVLAAGALLAVDMAADQQAQWVAVLGPLWAMVAFGIHSAVFVGLRRDSALFDLDREWLARISALKLRAGVMWAVFAFAALALTWLLQSRASPPSWVAAIITLASGSFAAWLGQQASAEVGAIVQQVTKSQIASTAAVSALCIVFILGLIAMLGLSVAASLGWIQDELAKLLFDTQAPRALLFLVQIAAILLLIIALSWVNRRVNVNRYSMHAVYRNRLMRAFLGSARGSARQADPFTKFDPEDNLPLTLLARQGTARSLFPVINITLNLTKGGAAAWSERKAMAYTATPLACGAPLLHPVDDSPRSDDDPAGVYVETSAYAGLENPASDASQAHGLTLATAMAISGAAVSPNWGYHSSPLAAFVMTLFNVRLGAWLPNPAAVTDPQQLNLSYPARGLREMLGDLLGEAGASSKAIYLSDGGHFDNLGLYEMLRRRCRWIVAIDAGADTSCSFEDLGNALRKASIDLQISIEFDSPPPRIVSRTAPPGKRTPLGFALATIHYPEPVGGPCKLIYIKPSLPENVPSDVQAYANLHSTFPHESTADQFFTESQFESYRALGEFQMKCLIEGAAREEFESLFQHVAEVIAR